MNTHTRARNHTNKCTLCTHSEAECQSPVCSNPFLLWKTCYCPAEPSHISQGRGIRISLSPLTRGWNPNDWFFSDRQDRIERGRGMPLRGSNPCMGKGVTTRSLWLLPPLNSGLEFSEHCSWRTSAKLNTPRDSYFAKEPQTLKYISSNFLTGGLSLSLWGDIWFSWRRESFRNKVGE